MSETPLRQSHHSMYVKGFDESTDSNVITAGKRKGKN